MPYDFQWCKPTLTSEIDINSLPVGTKLENWQPRIHPPTTTMSGKYCRLEVLSLERHAEELFNAYAIDTEGRNWAYLSSGPFDSLQEFKHWCRNSCTGHDPLFFAVIDNASDKPTGVASYLRIDSAIGCIEVGHIHFSPLLQGTRMATEAMYLMMCRVFDELGYRRYEWKCNALNAPSCRAAERFGFQFEGIFRQATVSKNRNRDTAWFAMLDGDWPNLKRGYQRWLADSNFDADGQQIETLQNCMTR